MSSINKLYSHPMFGLGLVIRLALIYYFIPIPVSTWYLPFMENSMSMATLDPWGSWVSLEGNLAAFPYGYAMWLFFLPPLLFCKFAGVPLSYGYEFTLLLADFGLLATLNMLVPNRQKLLLGVYWLSPIIIMASYLFGLNDLIPAALLVLSIYCLRRSRLVWSGILCAAAISAKLSMVVALPFFCIYLYNNKALRQRAIPFCVSFLFSILILGIPFLLSSAAIGMLLSNPELGKIFRLSLELGGGIYIYLVPLIYLTMIYLAWRVQRMSFEVFQATLGIAFLLIILMTPISPGWFIWAIPFLVIYQSTSDRISILLIALFSCIYALNALLYLPIAFTDGYRILLIKSLSLKSSFELQLGSLLQTAMIAVGVILAIRIWREAITRNDFFRLSRKPFSIGIAGDSAAGKDTFADSLTGLFGSHSVSKISGDDYHLWDRQKPMWQVMTHLNPMANDLEGFSNDLIRLVDRKNILVKHYDHQIGRMGKPILIKANDFIIASGLHALYLPLLRNCYNLKIFLELDYDLRRYFKLKRDTKLRGHSIDKVLESFERRSLDSERFIQPQSLHADLVFRIEPIHSDYLNDVNLEQSIPLKLIVKSQRGFNELSLNRVLVGICGLHVDLNMMNNDREVHLVIEGDTSADDIKMAAQILCPQVIEFLDNDPNWEGGIIGLMQLITLSHISQALTKRLI
ncbi:uridine kinase [Polynucleobacter sp. 73C-SIWE]|uniref:uridine kinase n=1 Tax=Polynucleobacter sp. 73C-SIWE TaxID=2689098 RepID=UPI001C20D609|nr:uridine kinase [Polynucleobacter sp. 73C-SIWE]MBU3578653.1 uridine kinase [Polynucleobacter sp. 73C-SIWE]